MTTDAEHDPALRMSDETSSAGRIWASVFVTLDGIMGDPEQWMPAVASEESNELIEHDVRSSDRMMFGATTFAELSAFWPSQPDSVPVAAITNHAAKTVVSSTLTEANWSPDTQIERDPVAAVQRLRAAGQKVSVTGSASLVRQLLAAGELDELRLRRRCSAAAACACSIPSRAGSTSRSADSSLTGCCAWFTCPGSLRERR